MLFVMYKYFIISSYWIHAWKLSTKTFCTIVGLNICPPHAVTLLASKHLGFLLYWKVNQCVQLVPHVSAVGKALQMNYQYWGK